MNVSIDDIRSAIRETGMHGHPECEHSSLRSAGHVEGGARAIVDGMLAERDRRAVKQRWYPIPGLGSFDSAAHIRTAIDEPRQYFRGRHRGEITSRSE